MEFAPGAVDTIASDNMAAQNVHDTAVKTSRGWPKGDHLAVVGRQRPDRRQCRRIERDFGHDRISSKRINVSEMWGGRGSNPRPTDYESAALTN